LDEGKKPKVCDILECSLLFLHKERTAVSVHSEFSIMQRILHPLYGKIHVK